MRRLTFITAALLLAPVPSVAQDLLIRGARVHTAAEAGTVLFVATDREILRRLDLLVDEHAE